MFPIFNPKTYKSKKYQLPPKRMVWCIQSDLPDRLCTAVLADSGESWIYVADDEQTVLTEILTGKWLLDVQHKLRPIQLSLDSVVQQVLEQSPSSGLYPCVGYMHIPDKSLVRIK